MTGPSISVVVATIQGWPEIAPCVESLEATVAPVNGEVIVLDASGRPGRPDPNAFPHLTWIREPGRSVFQLRRVGYQRATGAIVAVTEDHCRVPPDWAMGMLRAHEEHADAAAVGGAVENGATDSAVDWASFLVVQSSVMPPVRSGSVGRLSGAVNVSYKRAFLRDTDSTGGLGVIDGLHQAALHRAGHVLLQLDAIRVIHDQSLGFRATSAIHFNAGRTMGGFRRRRMTGVLWLRAAATFLLPTVRLGRVLRDGWRKGAFDVTRDAVPVIVWLLYCQAAGQFIGYALGPGDSPRQVQ